MLSILENANITIKRRRLREEIQEKKTRHNGKTVKICEKKKRRERKKNDSVRTALTPAKKKTNKQNKTKTEKFSGKIYRA